MSAIRPDQLAMPHATRDLMVRVAEAVQIDAAIAARGDILSMQMNGRQREAITAHESAHTAVMRIDVNKLVAEFAVQAPDVAEMAAFEAAAAANRTNTLRGASGDFVHPATQRAYAIWLAAVRWARNQASEPP